jgi:hypothetical protein
LEDLVDNRDLPVRSETAPVGEAGIEQDSLSSPDSFPSTAREEFGGIEVPTEQDLDIISRQLGKEPQGIVFVASRCLHRHPAVILTVPYESGGRPTPPLLWLSCPHLSREVGGLESDGTMKRFRQAMDAGRDSASRFMEEEERFSRVQSDIAAICGGALEERMKRRGAAGGQMGAVKCLHAHLAYRLASGRGIIGGWCLDELSKRSGSWCEKIPETCLT